MQFQSYKISDLIPASYNPRKKLKPGDKEYEKIKNSIKEFGYVEPIIINSDMTIIGGHQRATVLADLGYTEVECIVVDIDKTKEKALNVALNKITGEWNKELLADLIKDLEDSDFDVGITGFEPPEIEQLFNYQLVVYLLTAYNTLTPRASHTPKRPYVCDPFVRPHTYCRYQAQASVQGTQRISDTRPISAKEISPAPDRPIHRISQWPAPVTTSVAHHP